MLLSSHCSPLIPSASNRRQRRKKELVAKILARANGSHEVCGGTGSKITASSTGSDKPPVAEDIGCESPAADRGDEDTAADGVSGRADDTDRQSGVSSVQVTESTAEIIPSGPLPAVSSLAENGEEPVTLWDSGKSENKVRGGILTGILACCERCASPRGSFRP